MTRLLAEFLGRPVQKLEEVSTGELTDFFWEFSRSLNPQAIDREISGG